MRHLLGQTLLSVLFIMGLESCAPPVEKNALHGEIAQTAFPEKIYQTAASLGAPVYAINPAKSEVVIHVYRAGPLAKMGHNHVVASRDVHGYVWLAKNPSETKADLYVPLGSLTVDEPALRTQAGFNSKLSKKDVAGTRRNMMEKVLDAATYPVVYIQVQSVSSTLSPQILKVGITLHGIKKTLRVPVEIRRGRDGLRVAGELALRQSDFGIEPYSLFAGALRVKDEILLRFQLHGDAL